MWPHSNTQLTEKSSSISPEKRLTDVSPSRLFLLWRTYPTLGTWRTSSPDLSGAGCLLRRRWMQLKTTEGQWDNICRLKVRPAAAFVLTVCQCLDLIPEAPKVWVSEGVLGWHPLLGFKLQTRRCTERLRRLRYACVYCLIFSILWGGYKIS